MFVATVVVTPHHVLWNKIKKKTFNFNNMLLDEIQRETFANLWNILTF